jgi:hypothetical protein
MSNREPNKITDNLAPVRWVTVPTFEDAVKLIPGELIYRPDNKSFKYKVSYDCGIIDQHGACVVHMEADDLLAAWVIMQHITELNAKERGEQVTAVTTQAPTNTVSRSAQVGGGKEGMNLLPCPFCGGQAAFEQWNDDTDVFVTCLQCTAMISGKNKLVAEDQWNLRTDYRVAVKEFKLTEVRNGLPVSAPPARGTEGNQ